jgi:signal transduction histidine kinase
MCNPQKPPTAGIARTYVAAVVGVVVALLLRLAADSALGDRQPFVTFYLVFVLTALFGGWRPAAMVMLAGCLLGDWLFVTPRHELTLLHPQADKLVGSVPFLVVCVVTAGVTESLHRARRRADDRAARLAVSLHAIRRIHDIAVRFRRDRDVQAFLVDTLDAAIDVTGANFGNVQLVDPTTGALGIVAQRGFERPFLEFFAAVHDTEAACGTAKQRGARVVVENVEVDPIFQDARIKEIMRSAGVRAVQSTPLINRNGELLGMLSTHFRAPYRPPADALQFVDLLAQQAGDVVEHARAEETREDLIAVAERARGEAEKAADRLTRVQRITESVLDERPLDEFLHHVLLRVREMLDADVAVILVGNLEGDETEETLRVRATIGLEGTRPQDFRIRVGEYFAGRIAKDRQPLVWNNPDPELVWPALRQKGVRALAGVPLLSVGRLLGVLHVGSIKPREFADEDVDLLRLAGQRISLGIERTARRDAERRARETAEASNRAKDEFLAMLGHELRNPLSAIQNAVVVAHLDETRRESALAIARRQSQHLGRIVDDLLDVARIAQGHIELHREPLLFATVIERSLNVCRSRAEERQRRISATLPAEPLLVEGDAVRLEQVITNLLTNAIKYTHPGGHIAIIAERADEMAVLRVRDDGAGLAPDLLPRIFDLFMQGQRTLARAEGGLGIGLTLVRRLVELHGGTITAYSEGLNMGSEFVVRLPALPLITQVAIATPMPLPVASSRAHVLVVEDNRENAETLVMLLELLGHQVVVAYDGPTALDAVRAAPPDVALVDIGLPGWTATTWRGECAPSPTRQRSSSWR